MKLSVIIPAYNERNTLAECLARVVAALPALEKEIIIVDDFSTDGTREWLARNVCDLTGLNCALTTDPHGDLQVVPGAATRVHIKTLFHDHNRGKGGAIQTGLRAVSGTVVVIQDADLEYDPADWEPMLDLIVRRRVADVVFGSRFIGDNHRVLYYWHSIANRAVQSPVPGARALRDPAPPASWP